MDVSLQLYRTLFSIDGSDCFICYFEQSHLVNDMLLVKAGKLWYGEVTE